MEIPNYRKTKRKICVFTYKRIPATHFYTGIYLFISFFLPTGMGS